MNGVLAATDLEVGRRSAHRDLLAAVASLRAEVSALRQECDRLRAAERDVSLDAPPGSESILLRNIGHCSICEGPTVFSARHEWLRDHYVCEGCWSIPRERALIRVLSEQFPDWRTRAIHESSPGSASSKKLKREASGYVGTHYWPDVAPGAMRDDYRCENLERQTFPDASFDVVVTQDVMEHVLDPQAAFRDIARTLRPGGAHVFTTPIYKELERSEVRARRLDGAIEHLHAPEYHGNPIDPDGALVTMHYGRDITALIAAACGLETTIYRFQDAWSGLLGEFLDVLVTRKPAA